MIDSVSPVCGIFFFSNQQSLREENSKVRSKKKKKYTGKIFKENIEKREEKNSILNIK